MRSTRLRRCHRGFSLLEVMIGVSIISTILAISAPNLVKARERTRAKACVRNLRTIDSVKQQWAIDLKKGPTDWPFWSQILGPTKYLKAIPICPSGGAYYKGYINETPYCTAGNNGTADTTDDHIMP